MILPIKSDTGALMPWEYLGAKAGDYQIGQLLNVSSGLLASMSMGSTKTPQYICMAEKKIEKDGEPLPCQHLSEAYIYEADLADGTTAEVGGKLQVEAGGMKLKTGAGTFQVSSLEAGGKKVRGRWVSAADAPADDTPKQNGDTPGSNPPEKENDTPGGNN